MAQRKRISLPRFNLKESNSKDETLIYLIYNYKKDVNGKNVRLKYSSGKKVVPKYWTGTEAKINQYHKDYPELNDFLYKLKSEVVKIVEREPLIEIDQLKLRIDSFVGYGPKVDYSVPTLPEYIDQYCRKFDKDHRTLLKYKGIKNKLNEYSTAKGYHLSFNNITLEFKNDFVKWLYTSGINSKNTVNKFISTIKQFMSEAANETIILNGEIKKYHSNTDYLHKDFSVGKVLTSKHYLEYDEIEVLSNFDLSNNTSLDIVRDYFLMSCYTGLRISDIKRLTPDHIFTDGQESYIKLHTFKGRTTKRDNEVVIPVLPELNQIFKKYDFKFPQLLSEQKHNDHIKQICQDARINRKVIHKEFLKGEMVESFIPVSQKVTNHTGRYTFIDLMLNHHNIPPIQVQKMTGQSLKVLMEYERGDKKKNALKVLKTIKSEAKIKKIG